MSALGQEQPFRAGRPNVGLAPTAAIQTCHRRAFVRGWPTVRFAPKANFTDFTIFIVDSTIIIVEHLRMARKPSSKPTPTEVEILGILWERGPSTVREVHESLGPKRSVGYTGVLKLLQNMLAKELVCRNQDEHAHVYEAREPARMKRELLSDLMRRVFAGSASQLVLHLLEDKNATPEEIQEIERMLALHRKRAK
jgi:BlaI family penicillinase repressor